MLLFPDAIRMREKSGVYYIKRFSFAYLTSFKTSRFNKKARQNESGGLLELLKLGGFTF